MKPFRVQFESLRADNLHVSFQLQENNSDANDYLSKRKTFADLGEMQTPVSVFLLIRELK